MTIYVDFAPSVTANFQFQATLDGALYTCIVVWNLFRGGATPGWYLNIYDLSNNLILTIPLTGSPSAYMLGGLTWNPNGTVTATMMAGTLTLGIGAIINLTVSGNAPDGYNYSGPCVVLGPQSFQYPVTQYPGAVATTGQAAYNTNLIAGYFQTSTLVWRVANSQFEISP